MVMGDSGIFGKATSAKNAFEISQYEEEINMCILEMQTDEMYNGKSMNMETIIKKLSIYIQEVQQITDYEWDVDQTEEEPKGVYKGYSFYIDKSYRAHLEAISTGITINTKVIPSGYTNQNVTAVITIKSSVGISKISSENNIMDCNGKKEVAIDYNNIDTNRTYIFEVEDTNGYKETKKAQITNIDKIEPQDFIPTASINNMIITINSNAVDDESGIDYCEYSVKHSEYSTELNSNLINNQVEVAEGGDYNITVTAYDKAGNKKTSTTVVFVMDSDSYCIFDENNQEWQGGNRNPSYTAGGGFKIENNIMSLSTKSYGSYGCITSNKIKVPEDYNTMKIFLKTYRDASLLVGWSEYELPSYSRVETPVQVIEDSGYKIYSFDISNHTTNSAYWFVGEDNTHATTYIKKIWFTQ